MTGTTTLGLITIAIIAVIALATWIALVFCTDDRPAWRRHEPSGHDTDDQAGRTTARRHEENADGASREQDESTAVRPGPVHPPNERQGDAPAKNFCCPDRGVAPQRTCVLLLTIGHR